MSDWSSMMVLYLQKGKEIGYSILESPSVQNLFEAANKAYICTEIYAREFMIKKLDIDRYIKEHGWRILLESLTNEQRLRFKELLEEKDKDI